MTFSKLISGTVPHHNKYTSRYGTSIIRAIPHHWAGIGGGIERLTDPAAPASANYIIKSDGVILGQVPEEYRAWTSGSWAADAPSITIEVQNEARQINGNDNDPGSWRVSDAAMKSLVRLIADLAKRYGWGVVGNAQVRGHREFDATACPGGYLWHKLPYVREQAEELLNGGGTPVPPKRKRRKNMLGLMVNDGKARYGKLGQEYFATYDGKAFVYVNKADGDPISVNLDASFANVTYFAFEGYIEAAETIIDATVTPPARLDGPKGLPSTKVIG